MSAHEFRFGANALTADGADAIPADMSEQFPVTVSVTHFFKVTLMSNPKTDIL